MPNRPTRSTSDRAEIREKLRIDDEDLDRCLIEQAEYFFQAAEMAVAAGAEHEAARLELKEAIAQLDADIRRKAALDDEKLSETALSNRIVVLPKIKELNRKVLSTKKLADELGVLKEAYIQRSYTLKDLNASQIARLYNLGVERGATGARRNVGDRNRTAAEQIRTERYRPSNQGD